MGRAERAGGAILVLLTLAACEPDVLYRDPDPDLDAAATAVPIAGELDHHLRTHFGDLFEGYL